MFQRIFLFELYYRLQRRATFVYFLLVFGLSFFIITSPTARIVGAFGNVSPNGPYVISVVFILLSFLMTVISSAVMGFAMVRDKEHNLESILFTTRAQKFEYLFGRFTGSLVVLFLMGLGAWLGLYAGYAIGLHLPWEVTWKHGRILPLNGWHYLQPFLYFMTTNLFIAGSLFFISGALVRNTIILYTQGIILLLCYQLSVGILQSLETKEIAALVDPFGIIAFTQTTQYWTSTEKNTMLIPFGGILMYNRLLWMGLALIGLISTYFAFSFKVVQQQMIGRPHWWRRNKADSIYTGPSTTHFARDTNPSKLAATLRSTWLYFTLVVREIPFIAVVICGLFVFVANATRMNDMLGSSSHPTTFVVLNLIESFGSFLFIIAILYSGELVWIEHRHNFHQITLTLPVDSAVRLTSKVLALVMVYLGLLVLLFGAGICVQALYGYYNFEPGVYLGTLFGSTLTSLLLFTLLCFFIQVLARNKFLGFAISIALVLVEIAAVRAGVEANFLLFAGSSLGVYSDMNGYGHHLTPFAWSRLYWLSFGIMLFLTASAAWSEGSAKFNLRKWRTFWNNSGVPLLRPTAASLAVFVVALMVIYYNSRVLNNFVSQDHLKAHKAEYERQVKSYDSIVQPQIVEVAMAIDLEPSGRDFGMQAHYYLKNKSNQPLPELHLQLGMDANLSMDTIWFDRSVSALNFDSRFRFQRYAMDPPLHPGDSVRVDFKLTYSTYGFELSASNDQLVYNGTFINQAYLPSIGYNPSLEITNAEDRFDHGLGSYRGPQHRSPHHGRQVNLYGDDADRIRFEAVISTEADQIAIAPGHLDRSWKENGKNYFRYKATRPISNFYSLFSGRYAVHQSDWNGTKLEIYFHPDHTFNIERMMDGMRDALNFCSQHFGSYRHDAIRIVEFPRYTNAAQSFAQTIPYSEGVGFILKVRDPSKDLDMAYYTTVHEVAHQWWGQMILPSNAPGASLLTEGLAQYSALMVMKHTYSAETVERYLRYELNGYLSGRAAERVREETLGEVGSKNYLRNNKSSLAFFALQDYVGEDQVNKALAGFAAKWSLQEDAYPTSSDLIEELRRFTPDSLKYLITDLFEGITLFDNAARQCYYEKISADQYDLSLRLGARKISADSIGHETEQSLEDWIDIGVYGDDGIGGEKLIYLQKHRISRKEEVINLSVRGRPVRAGIDPLHKLIDRHPDDNKVPAQEVVDLAAVPLF